MGYVVHAGKTAGCFLSDNHMKMDPSVDLAGHGRGRFLSEINFVAARWLVVRPRRM